MVSNNKEQKIDPKSIQRMFDAIAPTYDFLNHLISFGLDVRWRKHAISFLREKRNGTFLDIAAGSGDIIFELMKLQPKNIVSTDFSLNMINVLQQKLYKISPDCSMHILSCDAHNLPFQTSTFDGAVVAFGIRNFLDKDKALREMFRVLKPSGIAVILELTIPRKTIVRHLYKFYTKALLPLIGRIISNHNTAYSYLPESINNFPKRKEFLEMMRKSGFQKATAHELTFGIATIFLGIKASQFE